MLFLNNYKKEPFVPAIQKTSTLIYLSLLALICFSLIMRFTIIEISPDYDEKIIAANLMSQSMELLKKTRLEKSVFIDIENDPNETGIVGSPFSLITTDEGDLDAKLTTLDPNFSAAMVHLMKIINLTKGDTVAILLTGSMPGANIAILTACKAIGVNPVVISSLGASQWGANQVDFTWLDMESIVFKNKYITNLSVAASIGGRNDIGRLLSPKGRQIIIDNISKYNMPIIKNSKLQDNIDERMSIFSNYLDLNKYDAFINVGGGVASLGTSFNLKLLPPGVISRSDIVSISSPGGIEGVLSRFGMLNVPILHILNIRSLTESLDMPFAPIPHPEIGAGNLYAIEKYNMIITIICIIVLGLSVFFVGYQSRKKIKEHLIKHEPDSLL